MLLAGVRCHFPGLDLHLKIKHCKRFNRISGMNKDCICYQRSTPQQLEIFMVFHRRKSKAVKPIKKRRAFRVKRLFSLKFNND
jgi:hypothetical protein